MKSYFLRDLGKNKKISISKSFKNSLFGGSVLFSQSGMNVISSWKFARTQYIQKVIDHVPLMFRTSSTYLLEHFFHRPSHVLPAHSRSGFCTSSRALSLHRKLINAKKKRKNVDKSHIAHTNLYDDKGMQHVVCHGKTHLKKCHGHTC